MAKKRNMLHFVVYSTKKLPEDVRTTFKIPKYPFSKSSLGPVPDETIVYFRSLGIIHYRDEVSPLGILTQPDDDDPTPLLERSGYLAYRSSGLLGYKTLEISEWNSESNPVRVRKIINKWGDAATWLWWNRPFTIRLMTEEEVRIG